MQSMATGLKYNKVKSVLQYNIVHKFCSIKYSNVYVVQCSQVKSAFQNSVVQNTVLVTLFTAGS